MASTRYLPHVLYSMAITSLGMHLLRQRKQVEADRAQISAQISILESTLQRLRAGERVPDREYERLRKLAFSHEESQPSHAAGKEAIGWKEVLLGRKDVEPSVMEEWEHRDLERVRKEVEDT
ncbi:hypothetical protein BKA93DRAFT_779834 [Sparassis latifolia]